MKKMLPLNILLFTILFAACIPVAPVPQVLPSPMPLSTGQSASSLAGAWTVSMQLSGGIAGLNRSIEISSDGAAIAKDGRNGKTANRQLTSDELAQFAALINPDSLKSSVGAPGSCADCFSYNIQVITKSGKYTAVLDDLSLPDSGAKQLAAYLEKLMNQMLAGG